MNQLTRTEIKLILQALSMACADQTDEGKKRARRYLRLLKKLEGVSK